MASLIPTRIVDSVEPDPMGPRRIAREFELLLRNGAELRPAGTARKDPESLLRLGYAPRYKLRLFDTTFYLTRAFQNPAIRYFVAYVVQPLPRSRRLGIFPRIFYKDLSLAWRAASHLISSDHEFWIGKGDVTQIVEDGHEIMISMESTTDLPLELQAALETLNRKLRQVPEDEEALNLILRGAPDGRVEPYRDFTAPRRAAAAVRGNRINGGRSVARFTRRNDPASLRFTRGFQPDFGNGVLEETRSTSTLYGGVLRRLRILSVNRRIQYLFMAAPRHVWIIPPQALTVELSTFGVRTIDVIADEDLFVPGFEYHFLDEESDPPEHHSQIPPGFAGPPNEHDPARADASPWLDRLPVVREFRRKLGLTGKIRARR